MIRLILVGSLFLLMACGGGSGGGGGNGGGAGGDGGNGGSACDLPISQPFSAPCCEKHGADACGASLFCAAFDDRTQATCYAERSRLDGEECGQDRHCTSGECNLERSACKAMPAGACTIGVGCAKAASGDVMVCAPQAPGDETLRCLPTGGESGDPCNTGADCASEVCEDGRCTCAPACDGLECGDDGCGGSCGSCGPTGTCSADQQCTCAGGLEFCGGECVDTVSDNANCGGCEKTCATGTDCTWSEVYDRTVCRSTTSYPKDPIVDCTEVCQSNGYPRCATPQANACLVDNDGCLCERDPA